MSWRALAERRLELYDEFRTRLNGDRDPFRETLEPLASRDDPRLQGIER